ncbi:unnamed protein product [Tilletia controversa]|nr:unnamed protein product [Tilletia controversa]
MSFFQRPSQQQQQQQPQAFAPPSTSSVAAPPPPQQTYQQQHDHQQQQQLQQQQQFMLAAAEPTLFQKLSQGAMMGMGVGATMGFLGAGPRGVMGTLSQSMLAMAGTFGAIMSIGSVIRTEGKDDARWIEAARRAPPVILPASARRSTTL